MQRSRCARGTDFIRRTGAQSADFDEIDLARWVLLFPNCLRGIAITTSQAAQPLPRHVYTVVVPWLDEQADGSGMAKAEATLAALEAAYRTIGADVFEIAKGRRRLELRWGELLGKASKGQRTDLEEPSHASEGLLDKDSRARFRKLAKHRTRVLNALAKATDADDVTRAKLLSGTVHQESTKPEWGTPQDLFDALDAEFKFTLDVCATPELAKCKRYFSPEKDGLATACAAGTTAKENRHRRGR